MLEEYRGSSAIVVPDCALKVDGPRYNALDPAGAGTTVTLPDARWLRRGACRYVLVNLSATDAVAIKLADGSTNPAGTTSVAVGKRVDCHLIDNSTANGVWLCRARANSVSRGTVLDADRFPMEFEITASTTALPSLRKMAVAKYPDWDQLRSASIRLTIASGVVVGSESNGVDAITTSYFFGSPTLLLINSGIITGAGGAGGRGGGGLLSEAGQAGGNALRTYMPTVVFNYGTIQGGGGGGGGGGASGGNGGGGGGGGGGYRGGVGGPAFLGGVSGSPGNGLAGGAGGSAATGAMAGGAGGAPGVAGTASTSAGGAAGTPTLAWTGGGSVTYAVAGTVNGTGGTF